MAYNTKIKSTEKIFRPFLLLCLTILSFLPLKAQEIISIGARYTFFSHILNEEREYWVYLPEEQSGDSLKNYPVLYLLDGDSFFHSVVGFTRLLSSSKVSSLSPCIVVAVLNKDRTRDFTPTASAARRDGTIHAEDKAEGGGAELFYRFLTEELRPEVEKRQPMGKTHILVGHSYAALFTLHVLLHHPQAFDTYIAVDPSLWWDQGYPLREAQQQMDKNDFSGRKLYVGFAVKPRPDVRLAQFSLADEFLKGLVPEMKKRGLYVESRKFIEENHGTVALPGFYDGLKRLFVH